MRAIAMLVPMLMAASTAAGGGKGDTIIEKDERIALVGNALIEQERRHGYIETVLVSRHPKANILVWNLGWGGDTVRGDARTGGFENPEGLARLVKEVQNLKPTVVLLGYGMSESFDGPAGLASFIDDYDRLLGKLAPLKARLVLLSPTLHEDLGKPLPDPAEHNRNLDEYTLAVKKLAAKRGARFVDLFHPMQSAKQANPKTRFTTNGILLTEAGYALAARTIAEQLQLPVPFWKLEIDPSGKILACAGTAIQKVSTGGSLRFQATDTILPMPRLGVVPGDVQLLRVAGLPPGEQVLAIDGQEIATASAAVWHKGLAIGDGPAFRDWEALRAAIVRRSELYYRRRRPFNDHSRHWDFMKGDFGLYDKEIAEHDRAIAEARRPRVHTYVISPKGGTP